MTWHFPAVEALGDAVVVAEVTGVEQEAVAVRYATAAARWTPGDRDSEQVVAVARTGRVRTWVSTCAGSWFEVRAAVLAEESPAATGGRFVVAVARELTTLTAESGRGQPGGTTGPLLLQVSRRLGTAVSEDDVARVVFELVEPAVGASRSALAVARPGGRATVLLPGPDGTTRRVDADAHEHAALLATLADTTGRAVPGTGRDGTPTLVVPLRAGGATVGALALELTGDTDRAHTRQDVLDTVAGLVGQAVQRARLFDAQLEASSALQHALLPPTLPRIPGVDVAARYRAGSGHEVGGDWYDVVPLPGGWVALVIGDVQGHDLPAAALMAQVRSVVRAWLLDAMPPTTVLAAANRFLLSLGLDRLVTTCVALVHQTSRMMTVASAGHAVPMLVEPGRPARLLEVTTGPPLGVMPDVIWRERTAILPEGLTVALYTDGLIERRNREYSVGERQLLDLAALLPVVDLERLADAVLAIAGIEPPGEPLGPPMHANEDDTALLLLRWVAPPPDAPEESVPAHRRTLPVTPASAVIARWYVGDLLATWGVDEETTETAVLLTDEIVANAVRHAHRVVQLDAAADAGRVRVEVFDDSHREPVARDADPEATSGRGLLLVEALSSAWGVRTSQGDLGKTVWFELELT